MPIDSTILTSDWLCREDDLYVRDIARWVVRLNTGEQVFADDNRPGLPVGKESAWVRLGDYCAITKSYIVEMRLQFRTNSVHLPLGQDGYYFRHESFGVWGEPSQNAFIAGILKDGVIQVGRWQVPELRLIGSETRSMEDSGLSLLKKKL